MTVFVSAIAFILLITGLILIHECGHFFAARKAGIVVEEFGFGLPPRLKTLFKWKGTAFTLNWIPFGGFVRLKGENAIDAADRKAHGSFSKASILSRCIVLVAGVAMNFLLALIIFLYGFSAGGWIPTYLTLEDMETASQQGDIHLVLGVIIDELIADGNAEKAGVPAGSILIAVDNTAVIHPQDVVTLQEGKKAVTYTYRSITDDEQETARVTVNDGKTGVSLRSIPLELTAPTRTIADAVTLSFRETGLVTSQTILGIGQLFSSLIRSASVPEGVTGIIGIAQLTYTSVQEGFEVYLRLVALLSLSLAVLNILPFPALDGGRLLFVLSELFIKPGSRRIEIITNTIGFAVLLFVILLVTFYDVIRLFT